MTSTDTSVTTADRIRTVQDLAEVVSRRAAEAPQFLTDTPDYGEALADLRMARDYADAAIRTVVQIARADGLSWQQIADALHTSRQAAQQRYAAR